ncbi:MAG TPA: AmmeMemoRadiSam system protein A [Mariprofundaceae bacterium]|nr:AmmeMemoRadiSam system protein A [Mariprofundaceae bacterium]
MSRFTSDQGALLLSITRAVITKQLGIFVPLAKTSEHPWLNEPAATFVTLKLDGELRGCIGSLKAHHSLMNDLQNNATAAAFEDPRFPPLTKEELDRMTIEVSLLGDSEPISFSDEADALAKLRPHIDGVIFECGSYRSTFLPQVWEQLPTPKIFMSHLKQKAGLAADFWSSDVLLYRYEVQKFSES